VVDITERKRDEEERAQLLERERRARAEAQEAARLRQEFLSIASHELKTPLTSVKAAAQLLDRRLRQPVTEPERFIRLLDQLQSEIGRLEVLVSDLLDASRIQQGRLELRPEEVDLVALAGGVLERFEHMPERGALHRLVLDAPEEVRGVWDPARIDQVLTNLISNGLKYSPDGGTVGVRVRRVDDHAEITVSDQGIGIAPSERDGLFQPFARGDQVRQSIGGTGLGLYIAAQIVAQHGGSIAVESEPGVGSVFTVSLPARDPASQPLA
jgi:signal transduction histidine kinase